MSETLNGCRFSKEACCFETGCSVMLIQFHSGPFLGLYVAVSLEGSSQCFMFQHSLRVLMTPASSGYKWPLLF